MKGSQKRSLFLHIPLRNIPLRWVLVVPFVIQIIAAVGVLGYLSYLPESDFITAIHHNRNQTIFLIVITLFIANIMGAIITNWIVEPIEQIGLASKAIAEAKWIDNLADDGAISEINSLSVSFNQMAEQLRKALDKQAVELKDKAYWLNTIIEAVPDTIFMKDGNGKYLIINRPGLELFDLMDIDYIGKTDLELAELSEFYREELLYCAATDEAVWQQNNISYGEEYIRKPDGKICIMDVVKVPLFNEDGSRKGLVVIGRDISDRKQAEIALQLSESRFRAIADASPSAIYILLTRADDSVKFEYMSAIFEEIHEIKIEELLNDVSIYRNQIHLQDRADYYASYEYSKTTLQPFQHEWRIITPSGKLKWLQANSRPLLRENGDIAWHGVLMEVTARKQTEIALAEAKEAAEAATKAKSAFLANMSHEIRTPMNGVLGMAQLLETTELTEEQADFVKTIKDSGEALLVVINDILDFSKIESGQLAIEAQSFNLTEVVSAVYRLLQPQAVEKQINLKYEIAPDIPKIVIGDSIRLRQILLNLVGNAVKFTQYGEVYLSVTGQASPEFNKADSNQYQLILTIADTGIGIKSDRLKQLFQPFTQADDSISRKYGGTGLGLAISKRLVELMGGTIWVESFGQIGGKSPLGWESKFETQGSRFSFMIAVLIPETLPEAIAPLQSSSAKEGLIDRRIAEKFPFNILLVEDNQVNQIIANLMLKKLGYQIHIVNNGLEALQALKEQAYNLIFMDIQMPIMDGLTATKLIREIYAEAPIKIVAVTANVMDGDRQACLDVGMDDYIGKPITIQDVIRVITA